MPPLTATALKDVKIAVTKVPKKTDKLKIDPEAIAKKKWDALGGSPGAKTWGIESVANGFRQRYQNGTIYLDHKFRAHYVYGAIGERYDAIGGPTSWLGFPTSDETDMSEGGRANTFENGAIYFWGDLGAIELNEVVVRYSGLSCAGVTNELSASDEPYVIIGVVSPSSNGTYRSRIYSKVQPGQGRTDSIEIYRGHPAGMTISTLLMENDEGDPDKYKADMQKGVEGAAGLVTAGIAAIPGAGPAIAVVAGPLLAAAVPKITDALNDLLGTGDDDLGNFSQQITAKEMVRLATRTTIDHDKGVPFNFGTPLFTGEKAQSATYAVHYIFSPG